MNCARGTSSHSQHSLGIKVESSLHKRLQTLLLLGGLPFRINNWDNFRFQLIWRGLASQMWRKRRVCKGLGGTPSALQEGGRGEVAGLVCDECEERRTL